MSLISTTAAARIEQYFTRALAQIEEHGAPADVVAQLASQGIPSGLANRLGIGVAKETLRDAQTIALATGTSAAVKGMRTMPLPQLESATGMANLVLLRGKSPADQRAALNPIFDHALAATKITS